VPVGVREELDPELLALQAPPQGQRVFALTVMALAVVAAMALVAALRRDIAYALASDQVADLGDVQSLQTRALVSNTYVRISGMPSVARSVGFSKWLGAKYRVFPLAGQRAIYIQVQDQGGETFVRTEFTGRLVNFDDLGSRYAGLRQVMRQDAGLPVTEASYLLLAGDAPGGYWWTWIVGLLCVAFVILDAYFIVRWFRPVKWANPP
jgi:hypothetical protein